MGGGTLKSALPLLCPSLLVLGNHNTPFGNLWGLLLGLQGGTETVDLMALRPSGSSNKARQLPARMAIIQHVRDV
jgi:hypothetical protein